MIDGMIMYHVNVLTQHPCISAFIANRLLSSTDYHNKKKSFTVLSYVLDFYVSKPLQAI